MDNVSCQLNTSFQNLKNANQRMNPSRKDLSKNAFNFKESMEDTEQTGMKK